MAFEIVERINVCKKCKLVAMSRTSCLVKLCNLNHLVHSTNQTNFTHWYCKCYCTFTLAITNKHWHFQKTRIFHCMTLNVVFAKMITRSSRVSSGEQLTSANESAQISPSDPDSIRGRARSIWSLQSFLSVFILILTEQFISAWVLFVGLRTK